MRQHYVKKLFWGLLCVSVVLNVPSLYSVILYHYHPSTNEDLRSMEANYPHRPIELVVAYKPGGGTDIGARLLAKYAMCSSPYLFTVMNRPGADGELGYTYISKAKPDGYTIGFINLPTFITLTHSRPTEYDILDVEPVLLYADDPAVIVVREDSELLNTSELKQYAKQFPHQLKIAVNGVGISNHVAAVEFASAAGIIVTHVPFHSSTEALTALRSGQVKAAVVKMSEAASYIQYGELRGIAVMSDTTIEGFEHVPTLISQGYDVVAGSKRAIVVPKGTPASVVKKLHDRIKQVMELPEFQAEAKQLNIPIQYMDGAAFKHYLRTESKRIMNWNKHDDEREAD